MLDSFDWSEFAAWLGLIPRQHSTGGKARLLGISKPGSIYLRRMFIHGARAMLLRKVVRKEVRNIKSGGDRTLWPGSWIARNPGSKGLWDEV